MAICYKLTFLARENMNLMKKQQILKVLIENIAIFSTQIPRHVFVCVNIVQGPVLRELLATDRILHIMYQIFRF